MSLARWLLVVGTVAVTLAGVWQWQPFASARTMEARVLMQASPVATPVASPVAGAANSARYLPPVNALGEGWSLVSTGIPDANPTVFIDSASAFYVGPSGTRLIVLAYTNLPGRAAVQRSWEDVGAVYESYRYDVTGYYSYGREEELAAAAFPEGCIDVRRLDGRDQVYGLPGAITQCAVDPDVTVLVILSGAVDGLSGYEASDRVATEAYRAGNR